MHKPSTCKNFVFKKLSNECLKRKHFRFSLETFQKNLAADHIDATRIFVAQHVF